MLVPQVNTSSESTGPPPQSGSPAQSGQAPESKKVEKPVQRPDYAQLAEVAADVQKNLKIMHNVDLQFSVHKATGNVMVTIKDDNTGEVIREIPSKEILNIAAKFDEMVGLIFDAQS